MICRSLLALLISCSLYGSNQELFQQANDAYRAGEYKKALGLYQSFHNKSWAIIFNMGNCWYQLGDYVQALAYWKRAQKNGGFSQAQSIDRNCAQAEKKLGVSQSTSSYVQQLERRLPVPLIAWQLLFLLTFYATIFWCPRFIRKKQYGACVLLCVLTIFFLVMLVRSYQRISAVSGIVSNTTELVAGTDERFSKRGRIEKGSEVAIIDRKDRWCKILANRNIGWVQDCNLEII